MTKYRELALCSFALTLRYVGVLVALNVRVEKVGLFFFFSHGFNRSHSLGFSDEVRPLWGGTG